MFLLLLLSVSSEANLFSEKKVKHIAIVLDGNRRWAKEKNVPKKDAHELTLLELVPEITRECFSNGLSVLTYYYFSTENWNRDESEVKDLMEIMEKSLKKLLTLALESKIKIKHIGRQDRLPFIPLIHSIESQTRHFTDHVLNLAIDYGGRDELNRAAEKFKLNPEAKNFSDFLDTQGLPDPDLLIRTGGSQRLSGFMLWQAAYSELFFVPKFFPDFKFQDLISILNEFSDRERRFGK